MSKNIAPLINCCTSVCTFIKISRLFSTPRTSTPTTVRRAPPDPPNKLVPPSTTAIIDSNSSPNPTFATVLPLREVTIKLAIETMKPQIRNAPKTILFTEKPESFQTFSFSQITKRLLPNLLYLSNSSSMIARNRKIKTE